MAPSKPEDREFIAAARADVPALIAEVKRLRAALLNGAEHAACQVIKAAASPACAEELAERVMLKAELALAGEDEDPIEHKRGREALLLKLAEQADLLAHVDSFVWKVGNHWVFTCKLSDSQWSLTGCLGGTRIQAETGLTRDAAIARARELAGKQAGPEGA